MSTHTRPGTVIWLIRREFWENRAIWMLPAVVGGLLVLATLFGGHQALSGADQSTIQSFIQAGAIDGMVAIAAIFFTVMSIYSTWYLLDCLHADRKDRSILFWKSLPISDTMTVACKLATALIVIPLVYFALADLTTLLMAFIVSVRASSYFGSSLWRGGLWLQLQGLWVYGIVTAALWYLPVAAWLLVVSAWAKRAVMLWSVLPPLALILTERLFLGTHVIANQLGIRFAGYFSYAFNEGPGDSWMTSVVANESIKAPVSLWRFLDLRGFFSSAQMWIGVAVGAALIVGAIQLRIRRTEI